MRYKSLRTGREVSEDVAQRQPDAVEPLLTERGWPRPETRTRHGMLPVPWVSPTDKLGVKDPERDEEAKENRTCQICGLGHDGEVWLFVNEEGVPAEREGLIALAMDDAILHPRCARLALGNCPALGRLFAQQRLTVLRASIHDVYTVTDPSEGDRERLVIDLEKVEQA